MEKFTRKDCENKANVINEQFGFTMTVNTAGLWKNAYESPGDRVFSGQTWKELFNLLDAWQKGINKGIFLCKRNS